MTVVTCAKRDSCYSNKRRALEFIAWLLVPRDSWNMGRGVGQVKLRHNYHVSLILVVLMLQKCFLNVRRNSSNVYMLKYRSKYILFSALLTSPFFTRSSVRGLGGFMGRVAHSSLLEQLILCSVKAICLPLLTC